MENYDLDLDYAGGKVSYFTPDHCDGHVVYWTTSPASVVPFRHTLPGERNPNDTQPTWGLFIHPDEYNSWQLPVVLQGELKLPRRAARAR